LPCSADVPCALVNAWDQHTTWLFVSCSTYRSNRRLLCACCTVECLFCQSWCWSAKGCCILIALSPCPQ